MLAVDIFRPLDGFTLDASFVTDAPLTALVGPSGSGKTLTLRAVAGIFEPEAGRILLDGEPLFDSERGVDLPPQARQVGQASSAASHGVPLNFDDVRPPSASTTTGT